MGWLQQGILQSLEGKTKVLAGLVSPEFSSWLLVTFLLCPHVTFLVVVHHWYSCMYSNFDFLDGRDWIAIAIYMAFLSIFIAF